MTNSNVTTADVSIVSGNAIMTMTAEMAVTKRKIAKINTASAMTPNLPVAMPNVSPKIINVMVKMIVGTIVTRLIVVS